MFGHYAYMKYFFEKIGFSYDVIMTSKVSKNIHHNFVLSLLVELQCFKSGKGSKVKKIVKKLKNVLPWPDNDVMTGPPVKASPSKLVKMFTINFCSVG